ncbi:hypothetical protein JCM18750_28570 [Halostagnicola bangensis]
MDNAVNNAEKVLPALLPPVRSSIVSRIPIRTSLPSDWKASLGSEAVSAVAVQDPSTVSFASPIETGSTVVSGLDSRPLR